MKFVLLKWGCVQAAHNTMREHPVPQDITGYNFHIIGNMTIKQFAEVGAGVVLAVIIYVTNLPFIIKLPLMAIVAGLGAIAAFVPVEEQPVDHWIVVFFKTLYKPTKYFWRKKDNIPAPFTFEANQPKTALEEEVDLDPARRERVKEYMVSITPSPVFDEYETYEQNRLNTILSQFGDKNTPQRQQLTDYSQANQSAVTTQPTESYLTSTPVSVPDTTVPEVTPVITPPTMEEYLPTPQPSPMPVDQLPSQPSIQEDQISAQVVIPELEAIRVENQSLPLQPATTPLEVNQARELITNQTPTTQLDTTGLQNATQNINLPFPSPPNKPNKVVGMVLTPANELINDAIVEIKNRLGQVVRAVKTNSLGQFFITTPLPEGEFILEVEKEGYQFNQLQLILEGKVVSPLEIRSLSWPSLPLLTPPASIILTSMTSPMI